MNMHKICANIDYGSLNIGDANCNLFGLFFASKPTGRKRGEERLGNVAAPVLKVKCAKRDEKLIVKVATKATARLAINL